MKELEKCGQNLEIKYNEEKEKLFGEKKEKEGKCKKEIECFEKSFWCPNSFPGQYSLFNTAG